MPLTNQLDSATGQMLPDNLIKSKRKTQGAALSGDSLFVRYGIATRGREVKGRDWVPAPNAMADRPSQARALDRELAPFEALFKISEKLFRV